MAMIATTSFLRSVAKPHMERQLGHRYTCVGSKGREWHDGRVDDSVGHSHHNMGRRATPRINTIWTVTASSLPPGHAFHPHGSGFDLKARAARGIACYFSAKIYYSENILFRLDNTVMCLDYWLQLIILHNPSSFQITINFNGTPIDPQWQRIEKDMLLYKLLHIGYKL